MEIGIYTFAEATADPATGQFVDHGERLRRVVEEIELADKVGLDVYGVGEHHRADYAASAPAVVLAAGAARTKRIRLTSAVTVLSSEDPVRVFQQFASLDGISNGRAEIMAGRGSFIESFPLFGFDLDDYEPLFAEKLELLLGLCAEQRVTWSGQHRAPLTDQAVWPRPVQNPLPVWIAVGGTPQSVVRAAVLGLPLALAIIGGEPERFVPLINLYREAARRAGRDPASLPVGINGHGFIAATADAAMEAMFPAYQSTMTRIGRERGWPPTTRAQFDRECRPEGCLLIGDVGLVAEKLISWHRLFGHQRTLIQLTVGAMPHDAVLAAIELLGTKVAPLVRKATAGG